MASSNKTIITAGSMAAGGAIGFYITRNNPASGKAIGVLAGLAIGLAIAVAIDRFKAKAAPAAEAKEGSKTPEKPAASLVKKTLKDSKALVTQHVLGSNEAPGQKLTAASKVSTTLVSSKPSLTIQK